MRRAASILLAVFFVTPCMAYAETYWVSAGGAAAWEDCEAATPLDGAGACALDTANTNAQAGDTVTLREGTYSGAVIGPENSGTSDQDRIVFTSHEDEEVIIRDSSYGIYIYLQSYITVDGIEFYDLRRFFRIYGGHYNVVSYCDFDGRSTESGDWAGAIICDDYADDTSASEDSTHNWVHHCSFHRWAYGAYDDHDGALLNLGTDQSEGDDSSYNLIEDNLFAYGGHHTLGVYSEYNVIRNNYFHNETNAEGWDFEGYRGAITEGPSAGRCLYEGNRYGFSDGSGQALRSPYNIFRFNLFYDHGSGGIQVVSNNPGVDHADHNRIYNNTFFHNGYLNEDPGFQGGMYFANWSGDSPAGNVVKNNIFHDNKNGSVTYEGTVDPQTVEDNWDEEGDPWFVDVTSAVDPTTYPADLPDLHLQEDSPCIDRGGFVTTVTSESGTGTVFQVDDVGFFMDGWGIVEPDRIQLEGQGEAVAITEVDYDTGTISVDSPLDWTQGQGVALAYAGSAPDVGAYEYGQLETCSDQGGACCSADQQCTGGVLADALDCAGLCCLGGTCEDVTDPDESDPDDDSDDDFNGENSDGCDCGHSPGNDLPPFTAFLLGVAVLVWRRAARRS